ncbi:MAG: LacI family DNA-binding transcriptional regulator [Verrucomicrobia bacterium]|nr:LacI family DNA-binding transcriptional regulator [Verrucomicrobiota bacterium]
MPRTTVAAALNPKIAPKLRPEVRERVQVAARQLGYVPHRAARNLASGKTNTIVLATLQSLKYAYAHDLYEQIQLALTPHGYHLDLELLAHTKDPAAVYRTYTAGRCDGVISANIIEAFRDELHKLRRQSLPVVTTDVAPSAELDNVYYDFTEEAEIGTRHLLEQGRRSIAFVVTATEDVAQRAWRRGYERALAAAGIPINSSYLLPWKVGDDARPLWQRMAALQPRPTGLLVYNVELAAELSRVIRAAGVRVPEDLALVSCGDAEFNRYLDVPLTAVKADHRGIAVAVAERLLAQINNPRTLPQHIWVKPSLVVRASSQK